MVTKSRKLALVSAVALALAAVGAPFAADQHSQEVTDARQESQIWTTYALSPYLRANDLSVSVHNGKAVLTGVVEEDVNKDLAKQIALGVDGITDVDNQIVVKGDYVAPPRPANGGYGDKVDDATITSAVKSKLMWSRYGDELDAKVSTTWGKVTLQGSADTAAARDHAGRLAMDTRGVVKVDNQLEVDAPKAVAADAGAQAAADVSRDIADGWITTKVKSTFMYSSNVDSGDIAVSTSSGIVTLSGRVDSGVERALAIELAQNVRGVKSVQSRGLIL